MAKETDIEWCDSTLNIQMGCDGCELHNRKAGILRCYAGQLTDRYAGHNSGFPAKFEEPVLFTDRLPAALRWPDLTGKDRKDKPWLNGLPRLIFLNDMGDTFTESLPIDWLAPILPQLAASPHIYMLLTKRPKRMATFSKAHPLPPNVWPGTSVTSQNNIGRIVDLMAVRGGGVRWVSAEPLWGPVRFDMVPVPYGEEYDRDSGYHINNALTGFRAHKAGGSFDDKWKLGLVIVGGESGGDDAKLMHPKWPRDIRDKCVEAGVPFFFKQWGAWGAGAENIRTGEPVVREFHSYDHWVAKATTWVNGGTCIDTAGRLCNIGKDFRRADVEDAFPIAIMHRMGRKGGGRLLDGKEWNQMPALEPAATGQLF